jgi:acyl dehydratase
MTTIMNGLDELKAQAGADLGRTGWLEVTQERVNTFADATDDHQFIHVDVEKAKQTPFGATIAHGFLTLSLLAPISIQLMRVTDAVMGMNYGLDRVRFTAPLPVGAFFRGGGEILEVSDVSGGVQVKLKLVVQIQGSEKPACVAEFLVRIFGG